MNLTEMIISRMMEKKANVLEGNSLSNAIIKANMQPFNQKNLNNVHKQITNPNKSSYTQWIDWLSNFTPEGRELRRKYDTMGFKPGEINTVHNIRERLKQPITDKTNIANVLSHGQLKRINRVKELEENPGFLNNIKKNYNIYKFTQEPEPEGRPILPVY